MVLNTIKNEENCAKLIVSGLVHYYFSKRVQDLKIDFKIAKNSLRVIAEGNVKIKPKDLEELNRISNSARLPEFENYYDNLIGLIPLSTTVHELVHSGYIFIPTHKVFGDYRKFLNKYKIGVTKELLNKIKLLEKISNEDNNDKNLNILKRKYIKIMNVKTNETLGNNENNSA